MKLRNLALFAVVCALVVPAYAASPVKAGKWQTTVEMEIPNMPVKMPPTNFAHCITKEQAENPEAAIPKSAKDSGCKYTDLKVDGNTVSWKIECEKQKLSGTGTATYTDDSYTARADMEMQGQSMKMKYSGKRVGDCDEK
jgi:hypothetical protein